MHQTTLARTTLSWTAYHSLADCAVLWCDFQKRAIRTPYQRFEWLNSWMETFGRRDGTEPLIVVGFEGDTPRILLPLAIDRELGARRLTWLADDWCDYAMPLLAPELAETLTEADVAAIWHAVSEIAGGADYLLLERQPLKLDGFDNPFARYDARPFTSKAYALRIGGDWDSFYERMHSTKSRRRLRDKEKRIKRCGEIVFRKLTGATEIHGAVTELLDWKVAQILERGAFNPFDDTTSDMFLAHVLTSAPEFARFYAMEVGGKMVAAAIGLVDGKTISIFQLAYGPGPCARYSPGRILIHKVMKAAIEEGLEIFDFSLGDESYKLDICDIHVEMMQTSHAVTASGWLPATLHTAKCAAKRRVKASERLTAATFALNRVVHRLGFSAVGRMRSEIDSEPPASKTPVSAQS